MRKYAWFWLVLALTPVSGHGITFSNQTLNAGVRDAGFANGPSFADYDGDGWPDLLVARFSRSQDALLYRNLGDGRFSFRPAALEGSQDALAGMFVDLQGDGDLDIFLLKYRTANRFYLNDGGTFSTTEAPEGVIEAPLATSALFGDFDGDGAVDLFMTHRGAERNRLYSGILTDHGADITDVTSTLQGGEDSWGATAFDYDGDGYRDLYVSNFGTSNRLYRNLGDGTFLQTTEAADLARPSTSLSAIAADFDNDSDLDLYVLNRAPESNTLYENTNGKFVDITAAMGVGGETSSEGGTWADFDNDGDLDLLVVDGGAATVWRNDGDGFTDVSSSAYPTMGGEKPIAAAIADYDRDGDVDVFLASNDAPDVLLRNDTPAAGHWLEVELISNDNGNSPLGAIVRARVDENEELTRDSVVGSSLGIVHGDLLHLGTGAAERISELIVEWPSGLHQVVSDVTTDQVIRLQEPQPQRDLTISRILGPRLDSTWETGVQSQVEITNRGVTRVDDALLRVTITIGDDVVHASSLPVPTLGAGETILLTEDSAWHPQLSGEHLVSFELEVDDDVAANDSRTRRLYMHHFEDVAAQLGVDDPNLGFAGAFSDYDNDGDLDLYLSNGGWHGRAPNILYRNDGEAGYTDVTEVAGVGDDGNGTGVLFADFDRDGYQDLFAARGGFLENGNEHNLLFHNNGDGTFSDISVAAGFDDLGGNFGVTAGDYDGNGYLDLFVTRVRHNKLYRNTGRGRFKDVTEERQVLSPRGRGGSVAAFADYDNDGDLDLYATNFGDFDLFYSEVGEVTYSSEEIGDEGEALSMSLGDLDEDGDLDLYIVNNDGLSALWRNDLAQGVFTNTAASSGVENMARGNAGAFGDFDNDGDLDIFVTNTRSANRVYVNHGNGTFVDRAAALGMATRNKATGVVLGDYDADGNLDVYVIEEHHPNRLFRNGGSQYAWLDVTLRGVESNLDGIGARVTTHVAERTQIREVRAAGEYSAISPGARFGLNDIARLDSLVVQWPSGTRDTYMDVATRARLELMEGKAITAVEEERDGPLPLQFALEPNFPNPFNATTSIDFAVPRKTVVRLAIYNSVGQLISVLVDEQLAAGRYRAQWHGRSDGNEAAASGVYFANLVAGPNEARQSIILIK